MKLPTTTRCPGTACPQRFTCERSRPIPAGTEATQAALYARRRPQADSCDQYIPREELKEARHA